MYKCVNVAVQNKMKDGSNRRVVKVKCFCFVFYKFDLKIFRGLQIILLEKKVELFVDNKCGRKVNKNINKKLYLYFRQ